MNPCIEQVHNVEHYVLRGSAIDTINFSLFTHFLYKCTNRYADRAKQIVCKAIVNEDPNAKV